MDRRVVDSAGEHIEYYGDGMCSELCDRDIPSEKLVYGSVPNS